MGVAVVAHRPAWSTPAVSSPVRRRTAYLNVCRKMREEVFLGYCGRGCFVEFNAHVNDRSLVLADIKMYALTFAPHLYNTWVANAIYFIDRPVVDTSKMF